MASRFVEGPQLKGTLKVQMRENGDFGVLYQISAERAQRALDAGSMILPEIAVISLMEGFIDDDRVVIYPHDTAPSADHYLQPKYARLKSIELEGFDYFPLRHIEEIDDLLASLPTGFVKDPEYGLGLLKELAPLVDAVEAIPGVERLVLSRRRPSTIAGDTYRLAFSEFEDLRLALGRTQRQAMREARIDKRVLIHNTLLTGRDPERFPARVRPYAPDTIFKAVQARQLSARSVSVDDGRAGARLVSAAKRQMAETDAPALLALQRDIELVTLEVLIQRIDAMLGQRHTEAAWQAFFLTNPFVLALAFNLPLVSLGGQISVGGRNFFGVGDKIVDFLHRNPLTDNVALVEIKAASANLLGKEYRLGVFAPSAGLAGAVTQLLDQRYQLQKNMTGLKDASRRYDLESYAVTGLLVAGRRPQDPDQSKSLELFRNSLKDVALVTYDELLEKLRHLHRFLTQPDQPTTT